MSDVQISGGKVQTVGGLVAIDPACCDCCAVQSGDGTKTLTLMLSGFGGCGCVETGSGWLDASVVSLSFVFTYVGGNAWTALAQGEWNAYLLNGGGCPVNCCAHGTDDDPLAYVIDFLTGQTFDVFVYCINGEWTVQMFDGHSGFKVFDGTGPLVGIINTVLCGTGAVFGGGTATISLT